MKNKWRLSVTERGEKPGPEARTFALELIKEKIDCEGKYLPGSQYELPGKQLKEYLAFAYAQGVRAGLSRRTK